MGRLDSVSGINGSVVLCFSVAHCGSLWYLNTRSCPWDLEAGVVNQRKSTGETGPDNKTRVLFAAGLLLNIYLLLSFFFGEMGLFSAGKIRRLYEHVQSEVVSLEDENKRLARRVEALRHDSAEIERIARERLGLVREGELVYEFFEKGTP